MSNIAIIPARSGSKGLVNKNVKLLSGKPLLAYSVEAAIGSHCFDQIMVSTDSEEYAEIAVNCGAKVPFLRSEATSGDTSSSWDMVDEVLHKYAEMGMRFDTFCLLQPTSPLRTDVDIRNAYSLFYDKDAIAVVSMSEVAHPIEWCGKIDSSLSLDGFHSEKDSVQRQQVTKTFIPNGAIFIFDVLEFAKNRFLYREGAYAYIMPKERSVDIDSEFDFEFAEFLMRRGLFD